MTAAAKINVTLVDTSDAAIAKAQKGIDSSLRRVAKKKHASDAQVGFMLETDRFQPGSKLLVCRSLTIFCEHIFALCNIILAAI